MARIAFLKSEFAPKGGLEKYAARLIDAFQKEGHEVYVLTTKDGTDHYKKNYPFQVVEVSTRSKISLLHLFLYDRACQKWLSENHMDAVFGLGRNFVSQNYYRAGNGVHAAFLQHRKNFSSRLKCLTFTLNPLHWLILRAEELTYENPALKILFTNSHLVKREILECYPKIKPEVIQVVHNGVEWHSNEEAFRESFDKRESILRSLDLQSDHYQFLFVGHEYQRKGLQILLEALSLLKDAKFELSCVGKDRNIAHFKKMAYALGIGERVHFFGAQKEVVQFYQAADAMVIPSYYDPFANVTVEALSMGLFVISSAMNGGLEVIENENMGMIFRDFKPDALARCLQHAMKKPKSRESAELIRNEVQHLDFSNQIGKIVKAVESTI